MEKEPKPIVAYDDTFARLDIRVGRIVEAAYTTETPKPTYRMIVDFGTYGRRISYGRFTKHPIDEVQGRLVLGVLNFGPKQMGAVVSEVLILGVQFPKAESGEATFVAPIRDAKLGSKLF